MIRALEEETGRPIGILVDLQGPKLRLGAFAGGAVDLRKGESSPSTAIRRRADRRASICPIRKS